MKTNKTLVTNSDEPPTTSPETLIKYAEARVKNGDTKLMQLKAREVLEVYNQGVEDAALKADEFNNLIAVKIIVDALKKETL
jgi:hypothetical protein